MIWLIPIKENLATVTLKFKLNKLLEYQPTTTTRTRNQQNYSNL